MRQLLLTTICLTVSPLLIAQSKTQPSDKFRQLEELLPTPNDQRTASGAPGQRYWQQRADYKIDVQLDDANHRITGSETVTYYNNSPDTLNYLWLQLDQNIFANTSDTVLTQTAPNFDKIPFRTIENLIFRREFEGGYHITAVRGARGNPLPHTIVKTMMRVDLPQPLASNQSTSFSIDWNYLINNSKQVGGRTGYEFFPKDGNYLYEIAQWFPRMAAYNDVSGWQHKQLRLPAEIWRYNNTSVSKLIMTQKEIRSIVLDPHLETADADLSNNSFPRRPVKTRFQIIPAEPTPPNPMQQQRKAAEP